MGAIERVTVELPERVAAHLHARVAAGEFADESAAVVEALLALDTPGDDTIDAWIAGPVTEAYGAWKSGRLETVSIDTLAAQIETDRADEMRS